MFNRLFDTRRRDATMIGRLRVEESPVMEVGQTWDIDPAHLPLQFGRANVSLRIDDGAVSDFHATLELQKDTFVIIDEDSHYGTWVDGVRLAAQQTAKLPRERQAQIIIAGRHVFSFVYVVNGRELATVTVPSAWRPPTLPGVPPVPDHPPVVPTRTTTESEGVPSEPVTLGRGNTSSVANRMVGLPEGLNASVQVIASPNLSTFDPGEVSVKSTLFWIGRNEEMNLVIREQQVSSTHACLNYENDQFYLIDYSRNGTWVDNQRLDTKVPYALEPDRTHVIRLAKQCAVLHFTYTVAQPAADLSNMATADLPSHIQIPAEANVRLMLVKENGVSTNRQIALRKSPFLLGRSESCDYTLASMHVSRRHVSLVWRANQLYVRDENSRNGVYLNDETIPVGEMVRLDRGEQYRLRLNNSDEEATILTVEYGEQAELESSTAKIPKFEIITEPLENTVPSPPPSADALPDLLAEMFPEEDTGYAPPVQVKTTAPLPDLPDDFGDPRGATDGDILPPGVLATLTFESEGDAQPSELDLAASKITVGTDPSCDMQINVDGVAPIHFTIWWRDGGFVISTHAADAVAEIMTTTLGFAGMFAESPDPVTLQPDEPYPLGPEANHTIDIGRPGLHAATLMFIYEES